MSNCNEIIERLEDLAKHAVHYAGEPPFVMSLDDGIALHDAINLLKAQEPRVMTREEVEEYSVPEEEYKYSEKPPLYVEYNHDRPIYIKWLTVEWLRERLKHEMAFDYNRDNDFGWRCWTSRPTPEQMRDTPWEGEGIK